ncbi:MAG: gluconolactonase, partial [Alphaproteobacteria bacterium]|nr:gluconolactonase [Alphaproteobacteria bacterium]
VTPKCILFAQGGAALEVIDTDVPCYACMLGGDDGRSLFMLTATSSEDDDGTTSVKGKLLIATVDVPHAGLP